MRAVSKKPAIFVPDEYYDEVFSLSKAALADLVWNLAGMTVESAEDHVQVMGAIRAESRIVLEYRSRS